MELLQILAYINALLTCLTIGVLIFLIVTKSPRVMVNYKYLMLIFSACGIFYAFIDLTNNPILHIHKTGIIIFSENAVVLPYNLAIAYVALNCFVLSMSIHLLCFHFIYRYFAVCKPHYLYFFTFPYCLSFFLAFLFIALEWGVISWFLALKMREKDIFWRDTMQETFGLEMNEIAYMSAVFTMTQSDGTVMFKWLDITAVINCNITITISSNIILILGIRIHREMIHEYSKKSRRTSEMQKELFHTLIAQTVIPFALMLIPASILIVATVFQLDVRIIEQSMLLVVSTYPFLDALSTIYFIKVYRRSVVRIFVKNRHSSQLASGAISVTAI